VLLTCASESVSGVSDMTGAVETANGVGAGCVNVATSVVRYALVNICVQYQYSHHSLTKTISVTNHFFGPEPTRPDRK